MQPGDLIKGLASEQGGYAYLAVKALGAPGLFGQALLCRRTDTDAEVVVKAMRADRPADDRARFLQEIRTLQLVARAEDQAGRHYAVRLLDQSAPDAPEIFLVLERAVGQNVLEDLVDRVVDWQHAPLDEQLALEIAWHFAQALRLAHQAGVCYDDMKLDNLFWRADQPADPLRVIDWNVTSAVAERGVAGDWARFGARLCELRFGQRVGVGQDGALLGPGPGGPLWQALPEGTRDLIEQALGLQYADDEALLRDLRRERDQAGMAWPDLLERARVADGAGLAADVLAPVSRAERLLHALPPDDPGRAEGLAICADLRQRAAGRRGVASARALESALQCLARNEPRLAIERLQKAYGETGSRDPRPRRWLWLAQLAADQADRYRALRPDLEAGVEALNQRDSHRAGECLARARAADPELAPAGWLLAEAAALALAEAAPAEAIAQIDRLRDLFGQAPDLRELRAELAGRAAALDRQQQALRREQELWDTAQAAQAAADAAEQAEDFAQAARHCERALAAIRELLVGGCSPNREPPARAARAVAAAQLDRLAQREQAQQIPALASSADPRERRLALARAEQQLPGWADLPRLRKQLGQIEGWLATVARAAAESRIQPLDQALAAIDSLERAGVRLDSAGAELRLAREQIVGRRAQQAEALAREQIQAARGALAEARLSLSLGRCDDALAALQQIKLAGLAADLQADHARAAEEAAAARQLLERVADERAEVDRALAQPDLAAACRAAQRLARAYPQLPALASEAAEVEQTFWRQLGVMARLLAAEYAQLALPQTSAAAVRDIEARAAHLLAQRQQGDQLAALSAAAQQQLRADADRALADLATAQAQWHRRRSETILELARWLRQAEEAIDQGADATARRALASLRAAYLPADAYAHGLDPIVARIDRLDQALADRRDALLTTLRDLDQRLSDPAAALWYEELSEAFPPGADELDPEARAMCERVRGRAQQLRQDVERVRRRDLAAIGQQIDAAALSSDQLGLRLEDRLAQLGAEIRRGLAATSQQLERLEAEDRKTAETLRLHRTFFTRAMAGLSLMMLVFALLAVVLPR